MREKVYCRSEMASEMFLVMKDIRKLCVVGLK